MTITRPMISYYGSKWRLGPKYPIPKLNKIIEPFAGGAGYSLRYPHLEVVLVDADEVLASMWEYLIKASSAEILSLPIPQRDEPLSNYTQLMPEQRTLIGFWLAAAGTHPAHVYSTWAKKHTHSASYWCESTRAHIARAVEDIRHWKVICGSYENLPNEEATWFVDPPYQGLPGRKYKFNSRKINYEDLGKWCMERSGQVIVCEQASAQWLDFCLLSEQRAIQKTSKEAMWYSEDGKRQGVLALQ